MMGTSTFGELSESLRLGVKQVNETSGKSSRSRGLKSVIGNCVTESKRAEVVLRYRDGMMVVIQQAPCL